MTTNLTEVPKTFAQQWSAEQERLLKTTLAPGLTDNEFALYGQICHKTGLDPFSKQIYAIKRGGRMTIQTGIDGYRVIAERTGEYAGGDAPEYGPPCACTKIKVAHPAWASVTVRRIKDGQAYDTSDRADFDEYYAGQMWDKMPRRMIAKCAEALALRRAFPGLFEGIYTTDEMEQADPTPAPAAEPRTVTGTVVDSPAPSPEPTPAVGADSGALAPGERPFAEGDLCPTCMEIQSDTGQDVRVGIFKRAKGGPMKGELQCTGKIEGQWANHPAPVTDAEKAAANPETDEEIPW